MIITRLQGRTDRVDTKGAATVAKLKEIGYELCVDCFLLWYLDRFCCRSDGDCALSGGKAR